MPQRQPKVHRVLLLGPVQEQGPADAVPHHSEGSVRELPARRRSACNRPACFTPARPIADIFILTGDIGGRGRGRGARCGAGGRRSPRDGGGGGRGSGGGIRDGRETTSSEAGEAKRNTAATKTTAARASGQRSETGNSQLSSNRAGGRGTVRREPTWRKAQTKAPSGVEREKSGRQRRRRMRP